MRFRHIIMTRFNLATAGREAVFRNRPEWLAGRFDLFEKYCLPTIAAQTCQDFDWIIYFDEHTPAPVRERIAAAQAVRPFVAYYTPLFPADGWRRSALELVGDDRGDAILTTNLDNDDGLANDYVERLHDAARRHAGTRPCALNFVNGFVLTGPRLYAHRHLSNAFTNLLEPYDTMRTAPAIKHMELAQHLPVLQIEGPGAWLQVVHGGNVSNKTRGWRVGRAAVEGRFAPSAVSDARNAGTAALLFDRLASTPLRNGRDALIQAARALLRRG